MVKLRADQILLAAIACILMVGAGIAQDLDQPQTLLNKEKYIPDIGTFLQIGANDYEGHTWDGKTLFFKSSMSGANQIYRLTEDGWPYQLTTFEDGMDFFVLSWGGNLAIVGASVGGSEDSQLYLMNAKTGQVYQLTESHNVKYGSVTWAKDDQSIFFRSNEENGRDFFIYHMDVGTGDYSKIFGDSTGVRGYNLVGDLSQDGTKLILYNVTSSANDDLFLLDLTTGEYQQLTQDDHDVVYDYPTLMPDNKTIWLICNDNDAGTTRLAKMKVGSAEIQWVEDGWIDPKWEVEYLGFSRDYKHQVAKINEDGYARLKIRELETKKELPSPPLDGILGGGYFDNSGSCFVYFYGPTRAPDLWKWNPYTEELKQMTFSMYAGIDRNMFTDPQLISYKSFDDLEIPAFLYLPPDYQPGTPIPFIVSAHGGPENQFRPEFIRNFQYKMLNGYGILAPNPRGSSGYGRDYMNLDNYKNRKHSLLDYKAGVDWLIEKGYTEQGMIGIEGGSYGGYVVLGMITEYPDLFSAAVDEVGISNFKTFLENTRAYRRALREAEYGPLTDPDFLHEISPIHKAHLIKTPLLVMHGVNDPRVPIGEARQIIQAVLDNGGVIDSLIFHDEGHGSGKRENIIAEYRKQIDFFDANLKGTKSVAEEN